MEHDHLVAMLNRLKLTAIRDQLDSLVDEAARREPTIRQALLRFCEREIARKDERRIAMGAGLARFPFVRDLDGFGFAAQPSIDKRQIREIAPYGPARSIGCRAPLACRDKCGHAVAEIGN